MVSNVVFVTGRAIVCVSAFGGIVAEFINILKLCVGADSVEDLTDWQLSERARWPAGVAVHVTRMWPKREAELTGGGSLYWVIKGVVLARQIGRAHV